MCKCLLILEHWVISFFCFNIKVYNIIKNVSIFNINYIYAFIMWTTGRHNPDNMVSSSSSTPPKPNTHLSNDFFTIYIHAHKTHLKRCLARLNFVRISHSSPRKHHQIWSCYMSNYICKLYFCIYARDVGGDRLYMNGYWCVI